MNSTLNDIEDSATRWRARAEAAEAKLAEAEGAEHEPGCPATADDESDYEYLTDAGVCACARRDSRVGLRERLAHAEHYGDSRATKLRAAESREKALREALQHVLGCDPGTRCMRCEAAGVLAIGGTPALAPGTLSVCDHVESCRAARKHVPPCGLAGRPVR